MGQLQVLEAHEQRIATARRTFFERGDEPEVSIPGAVIRSWQRCREGGLDAGAVRVLEPADHGELDEARERCAMLMEHASGIMEHVYAQIRASGSLVILADMQGMILHTLGDADFVGRAQRVALQAGASWAENLRGTNAIGTALAERTAVEVLGGEHFLDCNGFLTCAAAPVWDARGRIVGVFDISGDYHSHQRHTRGLVRLSVQMLEKRMFEAEFAGAILVGFHLRPECVGTLQEGLLAIDADGRVLGANPVAREFLGLGPDAAMTQGFGDIFRANFGQTLDRAGRDPRSLQLLDVRRGGQVYVQVRYLQGVPRGGNITSAAIAVPAPELERRPAAEGGARPHSTLCNPKGRITLECLSTGDPVLQRALDRAARILGKDIPLLIQGESGVGKELFARAVHYSGPRADGPFVAVNCAAIPENLIESELFGYVGGAFTGARREGAIGKVQQAHGGTLFLDEIGDMPLTMQARLLRVLQERVVTPVGSLKSIPVDISLACATHCRLREAVQRGSFREDLYYRVNGLTITLPALRERSDIRRIVENILAVETADCGRQGVQISEEVMRFFEGYAWPGNVRQLQNVLRVAVALLDDDEDVIFPSHLPEELFAADPIDDGEPTRPAAPPVASMPQSVASAPAPRSLDEIEQEAVAAVMREVGGNVSAAARRLGVSRNTLYRKLGRMS